MNSTKKAGILAATLAAPLVFALAGCDKPSGTGLSTTPPVPSTQPSGTLSANAPVDTNRTPTPLPSASLPIDTNRSAGATPSPTSS